MMGGRHQLIKIDKNLWIGNSDEEKNSDKYAESGFFESVLVTAHDMRPCIGLEGENGVEHMQVGLIDGPGNPLSVYHAAVLALHTLVGKGKVLVCDHTGGLSLAVVIMYRFLTGDGPSWDEQIERLKSVHGKLPEVHSVHKWAFFRMDWTMLARILREEVNDELPNRDA
jgi:hypothetical protein